MKIKRAVNGTEMEFELTSEEVSAAYYEQEHLFDVQDVKDKLEGEMEPGEFEAEYGVPAELVLNNESLLNEIAWESRHNQDHYGQEWQYARDNAISEIIERHREELCQELGKGPEESKSSPELPTMCYGTLASTGEVIIIKSGEKGYYRTDINLGNNEENQKLVDEYNCKLGVTKAQAAAMSAGSMFGWHVPGANPEMYDDNGKMKQVSLSDQIIAAEQEQKVGASATVDMTYGELCALFRKVERSDNGHVSAYVVFTEDSFTQPYSEKARTYVFSSDNKAFQSGMSGYSIYASCLDGSDPCLRLEGYMAVEKGGKDGWKIERCYMTKSDYDKASSYINVVRDTRTDEER